MKRSAIIGVLVFGLLSVFMIGCIFHNSMQNGQVSNQRSEIIAEQVVEMVVPDDEKSEEKTEKLQKEWNEKIRKAAHMVEFSVLGIFLGGLTASLFLLTKRCFLGSALFLSLLVGVTDEYIQKFFKRTSSVKDIFRDLIGATVGLSIAAAIFGVLYLVRKKRNRRRSDDKAISAM